MWSLCERFDGKQELARFVVGTDRECVKGAVGQRVAVWPHLFGSDPSRPQANQQFLASDAATRLDFFASAAEFGHLRRIIRDLENLQMAGKLLALFRRPVFNFFTDFCVAHVRSVSDLSASANPVF